MGLFDNTKKVKDRNGEVMASSSVTSEDDDLNGVSVISMETSIKGTIETNSMFQIEGVLEGDIKAGSLVHVGTEGRVKGNITAKSVLIEGEVSGDIVADKVEIGSKGKVRSNITSLTLVIQEGGMFEGRKKMKVALVKDEPKVEVLEDKEL